MALLCKLEKNYLTKALNPNVRYY
uniref:Uncharacterized protein n=1 Tax=Rhizophora mucronata TaxID=61149 RepID=A0A2P2IP95_RHIMU